MARGMRDTPKSTDEDEPVDPGEAYSPPAIAWTEIYDPFGFGISCAKQEGNPGCFPGPILT